MATTQELARQLEAADKQKQALQKEMDRKSRDLLKKRLLEIDKQIADLHTERTRVSKEVTRLGSTGDALF